MTEFNYSPEGQEKLIAMAMGLARTADMGVEPELCLLFRDAAKKLLATAMEEISYEAVSVEAFIPAGGPLPIMSEEDFMMGDFFSEDDVEDK